MGKLESHLKGNFKLFCDVNFSVFVAKMFEKFRGRCDFGKSAAGRGQKGVESMDVDPRLRREHRQSSGACA